MKTSLLTFAFSSLLALPSLPAEKGKDAFTQTAFVTVSVQGEVPAAPRKVWDRLATKAGLARFLGIEGAKGDDKLDHAGAVLAGKLGGEGGNLVVVHTSSGNEFRYTWEPDHGGYVCHVTVKLAPSGKGTMVTVIDGYSDEKAGMIEKNAADTRAHLAQSLEALKKAVL